MEWNVFVHSVNSNEIMVVNIFDHTGFRREVEQALKRCTDREEFEKELRSSLLYHYWCKYECEVMITPLTSNKLDKTDGIKVDVYRQVEINWDKFVDYVWAFKS